MRPKAFRAVVAVLGLVVIAPRCGADEAKLQVEDAIVGFMKAAQNKDIDKLMKLAAVPWLAEDRRVIKDTKELKKLFEQKAGKNLSLGMEFEFRGMRNFSDMKEQIKDAPTKDLFAAVIADSDWIAMFIDKKAGAARYFLVRAGLGEVKIVGGPYRFTYLLNPNNVPKVAIDLLEAAGPFELLSLNPNRPEAKGNDDFHGWKVLGKTVVNDAEVRKKLCAEFKRSIDESEGVGANCFNPRHGIRFTREGKTVDLVICFECYQVQAFIGEQRDPFFVITREPQKAFDKVLRDKGIPLAKDGEK
jgi:hypothetical protein